MKVTITHRGFELVEFVDSNGEGCSLQQSSATRFQRDPGQDLLWLGVDDFRPKILASKAAAAGIQVNGTMGWVEIPLPEGTLVSSRMHLDRKQVRELISHLKSWEETGSLEIRYTSSGNILATFRSWLADLFPRHSQKGARDA